MNQSGYIPYLLKRFTKISKFYDTISSVTDVLRKLPVRLSNVNSESKVLDVGTGTGNLALEFAKYAKEVVAIDISPDMLRVAEKKNTEKKVKFIQMNATNLNFPEKSFDIVTISTVLHEMPKDVREKVLKEIKKVSKNKVIIIDYYIPKLPLLKDIYIFLISLYESKYFLEFAKYDIKKIIVESGLDIELEKKAAFLFKICLCRPR